MIVLNSLEIKLTSVKYRGEEQSNEKQNLEKINSLGMKQLGIVLTGGQKEGRWLRLEVHQGF